MAQVDVAELTQDEDIRAADSVKRASQAAEEGDPGADVRRWLLQTPHATLCTLAAKPDLAGHPYGSVVPFAVDPAGRPFVLTARIAAHTANLKQDPRATLFVRDLEPRSSSKQEGDPQASWRASLMGRMVPLVGESDADAGLPGAHVLPDAELAALHARYVERVPDAAGYLETHDFDYWLMADVQKVRYIAGFGRICWLDGARALRNPDGAGLGEVARGAIDHMNEDHVENMVEMCAGQYGFTPETAAMVALDRAGFLVRTTAPDRLVHFSFGHEIDAAGLRPAVIEVLRRAREA